MGVTRQDAVSDPQPTASSKARRRAKRWPMTVLALVAAFGKADAWRHLIRNAAGLWALFGIGLVRSVLRVRPIGFAFSVAGLTALILHRAVLQAIGIGVGLFTLLVVLFALVGTVLMARQGRRDLRRPS